MKQFSKAQKRCLYRFRDGEVHSPAMSDMEAFFALAKMGLIDDWFDGCRNDNVGRITPQGAEIATTITKDDFQ